MSAPTVKGTKEVQQHYNSAWHVCNVKRSMLGYGPISEEQFNAAENQKTSADQKKSEKKNVGHVKPGKMEKFEKKQQVAKLKAENPIAPEDVEEFVPLEYNPLCSIFDRKEFPSLEDNLRYMKKHFGFDIFEREYVVDLEGLVRMLGEKVWLGGQCLQCNRGFKTAQACMNHMVDTRHTRINYEDDAILAELDPFYDYSASYEKFEKELQAKYQDRLNKLTQQKALAGPTADESNMGAPTAAPTAAPAAPAANATADNDSEWEDEDDEENWDSESEVDDEDMDAEMSGKNLRKTAKQLLAKYGLQPVRRTADGYLRLMDGSEAAPRSVAKIYKQRTGELTLQKERKEAELAEQGIEPSGGKLHGLRTRLMLTDGSHGNPLMARAKEEIKEFVRMHRRTIRHAEKIGMQANKFTRAAPEPQKLMM